MNKLYMVTLTGMLASQYHESFVVAMDPEAAYKKVREYLEDNEIGFHKERALHSVTLLAEESEYPECDRVLYL